MNLNDLLNLYTKHHFIPEIKANIDKKNDVKLHFSGLRASSESLFSAALCKNFKSSDIFILSEKEEAAYFQNDLVKLLPENEVLFFPASYRRKTFGDGDSQYDSGGTILRTEILNKISNDSKIIVVTYPEAIFEKVISRKKLAGNTLKITKGLDISIDFIVEMLTEYGFRRSDFVYEPGQYAVRGSIVDIFSFSNEFPYRIDFFGDTAETIRSFEVVSQLSRNEFNEISVIPDIQNNIEITEKISFFDFVQKDTMIWANNLNYTLEKIGALFDSEPSDNFISQTSLKSELKNFKLIEFSKKPFFKPDFSYVFDISEQIDYAKNFSILAEKLSEKEEQGFLNLILSENNEQFERLRKVFSSKEIGFHPKYQETDGVLYRGFIDNDLKINCNTEHQIFGKYLKYKLRTASFHKSKEALTIKEISNLQPGDYVVHVDHGIGQFGGLQTIEVEGKKQETVRLVYKDKDVLLVSIHNLHKISKYKGKEGSIPTIYKLGSGAWSKLKQRTKSRVKDIAKELIALYAKRKEEKGFAFSADSYLQSALESSFIYDDTPDQAKATIDVKRDMESPVPMDRLICGDVGFGKTEIAIRAAFKAVTDDKQVAVLVPTTVLALQHFKTFSARLKDFPVKINFVSRMKSSKEINRILEETESGKIDILIGTHRIVSSDVKFKDLGLMIVDEEQKFGVGVKEKLKKIKINVDTLTLTATPIPRTLQFSLMGARDLSIINTAPPNRFPIVTELHTFNEDIIREAINYEAERGGQVFFIHNRVENIKEIEKLLNRTCPNIKTAVVHGQLTGQELEEVMMDFIDEKFQVLIATSIVESGLDISNANTIVINNAQNFGLSDLHQLRGRVGRSDRKAFCILLAPPQSLLTPEARRRLQAIENFSELGSGFNIAMQDLDIRGAGNLLGGEQSGFIADMGFETYHRILDEALFELRENEFKELYEKEPEKADAQFVENIKFITDCQIDTELELRFPESYIENTTERLKLYRELDKLNGEDEISAYEQRLTDRFGKIPEQSEELILAVKLRRLAVSLGMEKIKLRGEKLECFFISDQNSPFFQSSIFTNILALIQKFPQKAEMQQKNNKLSIIFFSIKTVKEALYALGKLKIYENDVTF